MSTFVPNIFGGDGGAGAGTPPPFDFHAAGVSIAQGWKDAGYLEHTEAAAIAAVGEKLASILEWVCGKLGQLGVDAAHGGSGPMRVAASCLDSGLSVLLGLMTAMQGEGTTGFFQFLAADIGDLLGVDLSPAQMEEAFRTRGRVAGMQEAGGGLIDLLVSEFKASGELSAKDGLNAMKAFMGFVLAFTVREANISFLSRAISSLPVVGEYMKFEEVREYAVQMAENVGLGRLSRLVLRPLVQILATTPATWYLNQKYRPGRLKEPEVVKLWRMGLKTSSVAEQELQELGFRDADIKALLGEPLHPLKPSQLLDRILEGLNSTDEEVAYLRSHGWTDGEARAEINAADLERVNKHWRTLLDHLLIKVESGKMTLFELAGAPVTITYQTDLGTVTTPTVYGGLLGTLPFTAREKDVIYRTAIALVKPPRTVLSYSELDTLVVDGFLDVADWEVEMDRHGYDPVTLGALRDSMLLKFSTGKTTVKVTHLSLAEAKKVLAAGLWTVAQFKSYLRGVGYNQQAIDALVELYGGTYGTKPGGGKAPPVTAGPP